MFQCAQEAIQKEGSRSLFKGVLQPILCSGLNTLVSFTINDLVKLQLSKRNPEMDVATQALFGGAFAGLFSVTLNTPFELLKSRAQIQKEGNLSFLRESKNIIQTQGVRGLYRGFAALSLRDIPGCMIYFSLFEKLKSIQFQFVQDKQANEAIKLLNAGGLAGAASCLICVPQD